MTDYFALLGLPRRPWLDSEIVRTSFLALSAEAHPDRAVGDKTASNDRFAELNKAYHCLRNPKERLRHLLELEREAPVSQLERVGEAAGNVFFEIGHLCRQIDSFLAERAKTSSPLLRARLFKEGLIWSEKLTTVRLELEQQAARLESQMTSLNAAWEEATKDPERPNRLPLSQLETIYREYSFVARWLGQVQERIVQLAM